MMHRELPQRIVSLAFVASLLISVPAVAGGTGPDSEAARAGHVLNRIAYGPSLFDLARVESMGVGAYIEEQLAPATIDESSNTRLLEKEDALFVEKVPYRETVLIAAGALWHYHKGTTAPDAAWRGVTFDDADWLAGPTGIGYGDGDDWTVLDDMRRIEDNPDTPENESRPGYVSVFLRHRFTLTRDSFEDINDLLLRVDYDDGFKAYLNGVEVARANLPAGDVSHTRTATGSHEAGSPGDFDISGFKDELRLGQNVLAIQAHNRSLTSSDLSMIPQLLSRAIIPGPTRRVIGGISELQQLLHIRGTYSRRQLQAVLAEFWENHFTTDYDKLVDYLDELQNSDAGDAMPTGQAREEAAQLEYREYQFFYDNALGYFGDLLLYSATSPTMLVYLDNVLNVTGKANENYAREILELHAFGVDNRYAQVDIEELARCFTGWTITKVVPEEAKSFPASALEPPLEGGVQFEDTIVLDLGPGWKFVEGTSEPTPGPDGGPTTAWTEPSFDDSAWFSVATGIGYGDGDDATTLRDMRGNYVSIYLRRRFTVEDVAEFGSAILEVAYDDGYVAYLNGQEIGRSDSMENRGSPPRYDRTARDGHEATDDPDAIGLGSVLGLIQPGENVLAIQVHNVNLNSSDLSILPRLIDRTILPGSVENGDDNAVWTFRFRPDQHDTSRKVLFAGTPHEVVVPAGRTGRDGLLDATEIVNAMVGHPSTAEFICIKLIQRFVSDDITLTTYHDGTAPAELVGLLDEAMAAWHATDPPGHIVTVMRAILDPVTQEGPFWTPLAFRSKVKTPIEYINSSLRVLDAEATGQRLPALNDDMGMALFTRDDPDGYPEVGSDWIDTASMLQRIEFVNELAENRRAAYQWDVEVFLDTYGLQRPEEIIDFFDRMLYQNTLSQESRSLLMHYLTTDQNGVPTPLVRTGPAETHRRVREVVGLMLSLPQWHYQ